MYTRCRRCGRKLLDPESRARGFGPECWQLIIGKEPEAGGKVPGQMSIFDFVEEVEESGKTILSDLRKDVS